MSLYNQINQTNFRLEIPDGDTTKAFVLNGQTATLPGISIPITDSPTGKKGLGRSQIPGTTFEHEPFMCRFLVDENMTSYLQMYKWMLSINDYVNHNNTYWTTKQPEAALLHILDNTKTQIIMTYIMYGAWPQSLSELELNYNEEGDPAITCMAIIPFKYFQIEQNGKIITPESHIEDLNKKNFDAPFGLHPSMR
ncbi:tail completion and sheath stabilizer protein [Serratia phage 4S]|nr:tail completion and sheath stabilizer protein [Serratia phage 4S]